jgi:preprotein translocase subunit YajC
MGKASEIWKEIKPKIGEMLTVVNNIEAQAKKAQEEAYQRGLSDAWEAARKIGSNSMCSLKEMGFDFSRCDVADYNPSWFVVKNYSASEAIEKIRQYEQKQEEQIQIGDEIETPSGLKGYVVNFTDDELVHYVSSEGRFGTMGMSAVSKTGRHFPEIAEILRKMKENNG